jgi:hypothetical protein
MRPRAIPDVAAPAHLGRICVVRPEEIASQVTLVVRDNGHVVAATRGRTFACWLAEPGIHQIASDADDTGPTFIDARGGARYFVHQEMSDLGGYAHAHLDLVDDETGRDMIDSCDTRVMVAVPGHDDSPSLLPVVPARL